jgi:hypothetical protein
MADPKNRPPLDELIDAAAKLPPGPEAWEPIFRHCPELNIEEIEQAFSDSAERTRRERDELYRRFGKDRVAFATAALAALDFKSAWDVVAAWHAGLTDRERTIFASRLKSED